MAVRPRSDLAAIEAAYVGGYRGYLRQRLVAAIVFVIGVGAATAILMHLSGANPGSAGAGSGSCAQRVQFRGATYSGEGVEIVPQRGARVGSAVVTDCEGGGGSQTFQLARLRGVSPKLRRS